MVSIPWYGLPLIFFSTKPNYQFSYFLLNTNGLKLLMYPMYYFSDYYRYSYRYYYGYYQSYYGQYTSSSKAFIFSLKNYYGYGYFKKDISQHYYATYNHYNYGPTFGGGHDIYVANYANSNYNSYFNCQSYTGKYCNNNVWTGSNNFCADEVEVYYERTS